MFEAILDENGKIVGIFWKCDAEWCDLEGARIGGIEPADQRVECQPPAKDVAKIVGDLFGIGHDGEEKAGFSSLVILIVSSAIVRDDRPF